MSFFCKQCNRSSAITFVCELIFIIDKLKFHVFDHGTNINTLFTNV